MTSVYPTNILSAHLFRCLLSHVSHVNGPGLLLKVGWWGRAGGSLGEGAVHTGWASMPINIWLIGLANKICSVIFILFSPHII